MNGYFIYFLLFISSNAFLPNLKRQRSLLTRRNMTFEMIDQYPRFIPYELKKKSTGFCNLIRYKNIPPTVLLSFTGGWIMNPSIKALMTSKQFIVSIATTLIIMSTSMVINDIFDIEIDKVNNPMRPLVTGDIKKWEAIVFSTSLLGLCEFLSIKYLPLYLQWIIHLSILDILIYTKFLKPMLLIKNISCASLISFALCFSGVSATNIHNEKSLELLRIASRLVFFGSLHNEILLDICDIKGDRENNIQTLPIITSIPMAWNVVFALTQMNILWAWFSLSRLYNYRVATVILFTTGPLLYRIMHIKDNNYSFLLTKLAVKNSTTPLGLTLIYLCILARKWL